MRARVRVRVGARVRARVRVRKLHLIDQDEAARQAREGGGKHTERAREAEERKASWAREERGQRVLKELRRQKRIGAFSVHRNLLVETWTRV